MSKRKKLHIGFPIWTIVLSVCAALALVISLLAMSGKGLTLTGAWDCTKYNFWVYQDGRVRANNKSAYNEPATDVKVYVNGTLSKTLKAPALKAGQEADLGYVTVPSNGVFTWRAVAVADSRCDDSGSYTTPITIGCKTPIKELGSFNVDKTIVVYEKTGPTFTYEIPYHNAKAYNTDFVTQAGESYDIFVANTRGTDDMGGPAISSWMKRSYSMADVQSGNNIDAIKVVDKTTGKEFWAKRVIYELRGQSLTSTFDDRSDKGLGMPDQVSTLMGDPESVVTFCFD